MADETNEIIDLPKNKRREDIQHNDTYHQNIEHGSTDHKELFMTQSTNDIQHKKCYAECCYVECRCTECQYPKYHYVV